MSAPLTRHAKKRFHQDRSMVYRICKAFTVESGHMLSKHPERCRFPHGHTRRIEVVISSPILDARDMVADFKALKHALIGEVMRYDHAMALNSADPIRKELETRYPEGVVIYEDEDPTTEVMARRLYEVAVRTCRVGWTDGTYTLPAGTLTVERVRVGETPDSWAEYGIG